MQPRDDQGTRAGVHSLAPREQWTPAARKLRNTYAITPGAPFLKLEFGYYCLERWRERDGLSPEAAFAKLFDYDGPAWHSLGQLGWCEAGFEPAFEEKVLEDRGEYEVVQDFAGRAVLCFKGRRPSAWRAWKRAWRRPGPPPAKG